MISKKIARTATSEAKFRNVIRQFQAYESAQDERKSEPDNPRLKDREDAAVFLLEASVITWLDDVLK